MMKKRTSFEEVQKYLNSKLFSELELLVIRDMHEQGYDYPFIPVSKVQEFWAEKGIK